MVCDLPTDGCNMGTIYYLTPPTIYHRNRPLTSDTAAKQNICSGVNDIRLGIDPGCSPQMPTGHSSFNPVHWITHTSKGLWHWAVTPSSEINAGYLLGILNIAYRLSKSSIGAAVLEGGIDLDATVIGIPFGIPANVYDAFQIATGIGRVWRSIRQFSGVGQTPEVRMSALDYFRVACLDFLPFGGEVEEFTEGKGWQINQTLGVTLLLRILYFF